VEDGGPRSGALCPAEARRQIGDWSREDRQVRSEVEKNGPRLGLWAPRANHLTIWGRCGDFGGGPANYRRRATTITAIMTDFPEYRTQYSRRRERPS